MTEALRHHRARGLGELPTIHEVKSEDRRKIKKPAVHPPLWRPDATCAERLPPRYEPCGEPIALDSGAYCDTHKLEVRRNG
jgi:hypothetical protein